MDKQTHKTIDITPTPAYYARLKEITVESLASWEEAKKDLSQLEEDLENFDFGENNARLHDLLEGMMSKKQADIVRSVHALSEARSELERCGY